MVYLLRNPLPGRQFYTHISDPYSPFYTCIISRVRDSTHVLDGLLYHGSDLEIREDYTDTAGFTDLRSLRGSTPTILFTSYLDMLLNSYHIQAVTRRTQARFAAAIVLLGGGDAGMTHRILYRD
nr:Uncharacterised protein [Enterobacter mori]CAH8250535.1 Uncharacterised protein [Enterobacter mori]